MDDDSHLASEYRRRALRRTGSGRHLPNNPVVYVELSLSREGSDNAHGHIKGKIMASLVKHIASIELAPAKTMGLNDLGVPIDETTQVKKGKLQEFLQTLDTDAVARRYQNVRFTAVKTTEAGRLFSKLFIQFEVFGDDWSSRCDNTGVDYVLYRGDKVLHHIHQGRIFLPYCRSWYENQYEHTIPNGVFDEVTRIEFVANADEMQPG
ncbi:hypothetical protein [Methylocaldum sp. GT1BB]|uniref:hypothetical protein n=1 Tax=Methylocaldum sp. GT1BB TaxID=3438963 RepID=UPI003DA0D846